MNGKTRFLILVVITAAALALHIWGLGAKSLWVDEAEAWDQALAGKTAPTHPPLYFRALGLYMRFAGESEVALRLPSAAATALMVIAIWWVALELGWAPGICLGAAAFAAFSPYLLLVGQQTRMYGLAGLEGAVFLAAMLAWRRRMKVWPLVVAAAAAVAGVYTLHSFWFLMAGVAFLWPWRNRRGLAFTAGAYALVVLLYIPQAGTTLAQVRDSSFQGNWGFQTLAAGLKASLGAWLYFGAGFGFHPLGADIAAYGPAKIAGLALAAGIVGAPIVYSLAAVKKHGRAPWLWLGAAVCGLAVNLIAPSGAEQFAALFPLFVLLWVNGVRDMKRPGMVAIVVGWALIAGYAFGSYYRNPTYPLHEEDWRGAAMVLRQQYRSDDGLAVLAGPGGPAALRYYSKLEGVDLGRGGLTLDPEALAPWLGREADARGRVFLLYGDWGDLKTAEAIRNMSREDFTVGTRRFGEGLVLFEIIGRRLPAPTPAAGGIPAEARSPSK